MIPLAVVLGPTWLRWMRSRYRPISAALGQEERDRLGTYFEPSMMDAVRVARVTSIRLPVARAFSKVTGGTLLYEAPAAIALIDTIVVSESRQRKDERLHDDDDSPLLFHELVHVAQFRCLGVRRFVRAYVSGWIDGGCSYLNIPLERQAYELQDRYTESPGERFRVEAEVDELAKLLGL